jgi:hypothetical protein
MHLTRTHLPAIALVVMGLAACGDGAAASAGDAASEREAQIYAELIPLAATKQQHDGERIFVATGRVPTREGDEPGRVSAEVQERVDELVDDEDLTWVDDPQDAYVSEGGGIQGDGVLLRLGTLAEVGDAVQVIALTEAGNVGGFSATYMAVREGDAWRVSVVQNGPQS